MADITSPTPGTHFSNGISAQNIIGLCNDEYPIASETRWQFNLTGAESTANAGSNLQLQAIADNGTTIIATPITITRSTGAIVFAGNPTQTGYSLETVGNALTAVGANRAAALQLAAQINVISSAAASTGVLLPVGVIGMVITVYNNGANPIKVYATASETIDGTAGATGVTLTNALRCQYTFTAANTWISAQLGVVSA